MYWVIQENLYNEEGFNDLLRVLNALELPYTIHKVIPFSHQLIPEINPKNPVIVIGAYTMIKIARERGWEPGAYANSNFEFKIQHFHWGNELLNCSAWHGRLMDVPKLNDEFFIRPSTDSKFFTGTRQSWEDFNNWRDRIIALGQEGQVTAETDVIVAPIQTIFREYRTWVINQKIITASLYRDGNIVRYDSCVPENIISYANEIAKRWSPVEAYALDIAETPNGPKIIETNCINSAAFYAGNVGKIVAAIEGLL